MENIYAQLSLTQLNTLRDLKVAHIEKMGEWIAAHPEALEDGMRIIAVYSSETTQIDAAIWAKNDELGRLLGHRV